MSKHCQIGENSPPQGVKKALSSREAHTMSRTGGQKDHTAGWAGSTTSTERKKSSHTGQRGVSGRGMQSTQQYAPQLWHFSAGGHWVSILHCPHLTSTGGGSSFSPLPKPGISSWERSSRAEISPRRCEGVPSLLAPASDPAARWHEP